MNTTTNSQITDSITQAGENVGSAAPAMAASNLYLATAQALANAAHNATLAQQQTNMLAQAATAQGVAMLYAIGRNKT